MICLCLSQVTSTAQPMADSGEEALSWNTNKFDLGHVTQNEPVMARFEFVNTTNEMVFITSAKGGCSCTKVNFPKEGIAPGELGFVEAQYNAKRIGKFSKTVSVLTSAQEQPFQLKISGKVSADASSETAILLSK